MIPHNFSYQRPQTVDDALRALVASDGDGLLLAGGHSLIPMMKLRLAQPSTLIDLSAIGELRGIRADGDAIIIGAMTTQHEIIQSPELARACPILAETARQIADPQVRYCGTIGGNAANGDPGNDMPATLIALGASYQLRGQSDRMVAARDYYQGAYFTAREDGEILTAIRIPLPPPDHGYAYEKQKRKIGDYATAAVAATLTVTDGVIHNAALALTNLADTPLAVAAAADAINGSAGDAESITRAVAACRAVCNPASDQRGPAEFRVYVAGILAARAIRRAIARATQ